MVHRGTDRAEPPDHEQLLDTHSREDGHVDSPEARDRTVVRGAAGSALRDRDAAGRARNARPRDALGRPLPYGAAGEERAPEGIVRTPGRALAEAQELLDAGRPFHAHEVLEDAWKSAPDRERQLWRGLAQLAVGLTHAARGNARGAATLLDRGAGNIAGSAAAPPHGIDVAGLVSWARDRAAVAAAGRPVDLTAPRLRGPAG
jgi:uncharacterized protein